MVAGGGHKRRSRSAPASKAHMVTKLSEVMLLDEALQWAVDNSKGFTATKAAGYIFPQSAATFNRAKAKKRKAADSGRGPARQTSPASAPALASPAPNLAPTGRRVSPSPFIPLLNDFDPRHMLCPEDDASLVMWINLMARSMQPPTEEEFRDNVSPLPPSPPPRRCCWRHRKDLIVLGPTRACVDACVPHTPATHPPARVRAHRSCFCCGADTPTTRTKPTRGLPCG